MDIRTDGGDGSSVAALILVHRLMREDNLLCLRARPFVPRTTDSRHGFAIVPNLIRSFVPTGIDQIWHADITYGAPGDRQGVDGESPLQ